MLDACHVKQISAATTEKHPAGDARWTCIMEACVCVYVCFHRMLTSSMASVEARKGFKEWPPGLGVTTFTKCTEAFFNTLHSEDINTVDTADLTACQMSVIVFICNSLYQDVTSTSFYFCKAGCL